MSRLNWNRPRKIYEPWYSRLDRDPFRKIGLLTTGNNSGGSANVDKMSGEGAGADLSARADKITERQARQPRTLVYERLVGRDAGLSTKIDKKLTATADVSLSPMGDDYSGELRTIVRELPEDQARQRKPGLSPIGDKITQRAFSAPAALRTWDLHSAREELCLAKEAVVFCDGSCEPNPGVMGFGAVIVAGAERVELFSGGGIGTNNHAELASAIFALQALRAGCRVAVYADSQYLIRGMNEWLVGWRRKGFMRAGVEIPNADLWRTLDALNSSRSVTWTWIRGHGSNRGNQIADQLATLGRSEGLR